MSDLLNIGSSALTAYRYALNAVGENVANAESPGYSRRTVTLQQSESGAGRDPVYRESIVFNGVVATGVARGWDAFKATEARHSATAAGRTEVRQQWLTALETALNDGAAGVGAAIGSFYNATTSLSATPLDRMGRSAVLMALEDVAAAFRSTAEALARISDGVENAARIDAEALNSALASLHDINGTIRSAAPNGTARASLEDERDRLIDYVAQRIDIKTSIGGDGTVGLELAGATGVSLLSGLGPSFVTVVPAADGRLSLQLSTNGTTVPLPASGGRLAGLVDMSQATAERRADLDGLATSFRAGINAWSAAGRDLNNNAGPALIGLTAGAASMRVLISDPVRVAAATTSAANGNLLLLQSSRQTSGYEDRWARMVSGNAQALASARSEASAAASWRDRSYASLDEVTGIDLDHEAAEMLRYQQAYSGAARIVQVARETVNAIFDLF